MATTDYVNGVHLAHAVCADCHGCIDENCHGCQRRWCLGTYLGRSCDRCPHGILTPRGDGTRSADRVPCMLARGHSGVCCPTPRRV